MEKKQIELSGVIVVDSTALNAITSLLSKSPEGVVLVDNLQRKGVRNLNTEELKVLNDYIKSQLPKEEKPKKK